MTAWATQPLVQVADVRGGKRLPKGSALQPVDNGAPYIRIVDLQNWQIREDALVFVPTHVQLAINRYRVKSGDVFISIVGSVGLVALIQPSLEGAYLTENAARIVVNPNLIDALYLKYFLQSPAGQQEIRKVVVGSTQEKLAIFRIRDLPIPIPPLGQQRGIAATLGALDDKIESNRLVIDLIEAIGDALFAQAHSTTLALSEAASLTMGSSPPGASYNEVGVGMPFYQGVRDFGRRYPGRRVWTNAPVRVAQPNDTLVSVRAPVGELNRALEVCCVGRGVAAVHGKWPSTIYYALRASSAFWEPFQQEGTVFGAINRADLAAANVPWPDSAHLVNLEIRLVALDNQIHLLTSQNDRLVQLRDALLPELLSGRTRVPESREAVT
jgi:type I restriction enzyme S subunit